MLQPLRQFCLRAGFAAVAIGVAGAWATDRWCVGWRPPWGAFRHGLINLNALCGLKYEGTMEDPYASGLMNDPTHARQLRALARQAMPSVNSKTAHVLALPYGRGPQGWGWPFMSTDWRSLLFITYNDDNGVEIAATLHGGSPVLIAGWLGNIAAFGAAGFAVILALRRFVHSVLEKRRPAAFPVVVVEVDNGN